VSIAVVHNGSNTMVTVYLRRRTSIILTYLSIKTLGKGLAGVNDEITYYKATQRTVIRRSTYSQRPVLIYLVS